MKILSRGSSNKFLPSRDTRVLKHMNNSRAIGHKNWHHLIFFFQDADDIDYICTNPEIVRVPDPEILLVLKLAVFIWCFFACW